MGMCELLGCLPSELRERYPNMTHGDRLSLMTYVLVKEARMAGKIGEVLGMMFGGKEKKGGAW